MLTLHTFADSHGHERQALERLQGFAAADALPKTMDVLMGGTDFMRAEEKQRELLAEEVSAAPCPRTFSEDELQAHFEHLPAALFSNSHREGNRGRPHAGASVHAPPAHRGREGAGAGHLWHNEPDRGYTA